MTELRIDTGVSEDPKIECPRSDTVLMFVSRCRADADAASGATFIVCTKLDCPLHHIEAQLTTES